MLAERLKISCLVLIVIFTIGLVGFKVLEDLSWFDALYLTVVTIATVGYGDIVPQTVPGRIFTMIFIIAGFGLAYYTLTLVVSMGIEGQLADMFGRRGMRKRIANLSNHIIVCGAGKVGSNVIERLSHEPVDFVVIEHDAVLCGKLIEQKVLAVQGDATLDEVLLGVGVAKAKGIITALSHDADNVYVTLTARSLNPQINIVARAERREAEEKLRRAGANTVISPSVMGGRQMVSALTRPVIMDFVENVFYNQQLHLDIAEIKVTATSPLVGMTFATSGIKDKYDSIVVAVKRNSELITNPKAGETIQSNDILITLGQRGSLSELNKIASAQSC